MQSAVHPYLELAIGKEMAAKIRNLLKYHFLHYNLETEEHTVATIRLEDEKRPAEGTVEEVSL
ncbi:MAG: hypothetical protein QGI09_11005 [Dehalococcoidia bacterium]|nr:hypothetical protein [Dehalococcoidia bacterium]